MSVSRSEASSWTSIGSQQSSKRTYASVNAAIDSSSTLKVRNAEVFLQGSYANNTNTRGNSDVDVVVMTSATFGSDKSVLSSSAKQRHEREYIDATATVLDFRHQVYETLKDYYGVDRLEAKDKCIRVHGNDGYVDADVVPCSVYRKYNQVDPVDFDEAYTEGIKIQSLSSDIIVNFPKEHIANGRSKSSVTNQNYKKTVRQLKKLNRKAASSYGYDPSVAPGYLIECMTFNVPNNLFVDDEYIRLVGVAKWLNSAVLDDFWSCDNIHKLFKTDPGGFSASEAKRILSMMWNTI